MTQLIALAAAVIFAAPLSIDLQSLLPPDGTPSGWVRDGDAAIYNASNLSEHLGDSAAPFLGNGFKEMVVQYYRNGGKEIKVEIYDMGNTDNAEKVFLDVNDGKDIGTDLGQGSLVEDNQIAFYSQNFMVQVSCEESGEELSQAMAALAMSVDAFLF